jgi:hypothetical protein
LTLRDGARRPRQTSLPAVTHRHDAAIQTFWFPTAHRPTTLLIMQRYRASSPEPIGAFLR